MHLLNEIDRIEQICFARAGRAAAHVNAADRAGLREDDGAPGGPRVERVVADLQPADGGQATVRRGRSVRRGGCLRSGDQDRQRDGRASRNADHVELPTIESGLPAA